MRVKILVIIFFITIKLLSLNITARVVNDAGKPIRDVIITYKDKAIISQKNGYFNINNVSAEDEVKFHKINYQDKTEAAGNIEKTVILQDKVITIQGLRVIEEMQKGLIGSSEVIVIRSENNSGSAADILRESSDLQISGLPLFGEEQKIIFPGYKARHTLIMLDGIPLNKSGTAFDISTIPAEIIESIEVVKGSSSSIAGAGSMGGIININTKQAQSRYKINAVHTFGSFGLDQHSIALSRSTSKVQIYAYFRKSFTRNDFTYIPQNDPDILKVREHNEKSIYDANLNLAYTSPIGMFAYKLLFQDFFRKLPGNIESLEWYKNSRLTGQTQKHVFNYSRKIMDYNLKADLYYSLDKSVYDNTRLDDPWAQNIYLATLARNKQQSREVKLHSEYLSDIFYIDWGGDYRYEEFKYTDLNYPEQSTEKVFRENFAVFGKTKLRQKHFPYITSLTGSARWDNTTGFDDHTSWKLEPEFSYENYFMISLGGNVANGYTLPSYYNLFWKGDSHVSGNPDLKPEGSLSWQIFSKFIISKYIFKVAYRHDDIDDMIIWFRDEWSKWKPRNLSTAEVDNWELEVNVKPYKFMELVTIYTKSSAVNRTENDPSYDSKILYVPDHSLNINLKIRTRKFKGNISYKLIGEQWTNSDQSTTEHQLAAYDLLNAGVEYSVVWQNFRVTPYIKVDNIMNKLYEIYDHVPRPGINWEINLGIEYKI